MIKMNSMMERTMTEMEIMAEMQMQMMVNLKRKLDH